MVFEEFGMKYFSERGQRQTLVLPEDRFAAVQPQFARRVPHQHALLVLEVLQLVAQLLALLEARRRQLELLRALEDALVEQQNGPAHGAGRARAAEEHLAGPADALVDLGDGADAVQVFQEGLFLEFRDDRSHKLAWFKNFPGPMNIHDVILISKLHTLDKILPLFHLSLLKKITELTQSRNRLPI